MHRLSGVRVRRELRQLPMLGGERMRKRLKSWMSAPPIVLPPWFLTVAYALFFLLGVSASVAGVPTLDLTTPQGYTLVWAIIIGVSGALATVGSMSASKRAEKFESWGVGILSCWLFPYIVGAFSLIAEGGPKAADRASFAIVLCLMALIPFTRSFYLLRKLALSRYEKKHPTMPAGD